MENLWLFLIWLAVSTIYLADSLLITIMMGGSTRPAVRQEWLAAPLAFTFGALLLTPWAPWAGAFLATALALHLAGHLLGVRQAERVLEPAPAHLVERVGGLAARWGTPVPARVLVDPTDRLEPGVMGLCRQSLLLPAAALEGLRREKGSASQFGVALTGTSSHLMLRLKSLLNPSAPPAHLEIPRWVPGGEKARLDREAGTRRPPAGVLLRCIHVALSAGYLALFLFLIRLV